MSDTVETTPDPIKVGVELTNGNNVVRPAKSPKVSVDIAPMIAAGTCPGCGYTGSTKIGSLPAGDVFECDGCETAWIPSALGVPATSVESIGNTADLAADLRALGASLKPGDTLTFSADRRQRGFDMLQADNSFDGKRTLFSRGGIIRAAVNAGFIIASSSAVAVTIQKPDAHS